MDKGIDKVFKKLMAEQQKIILLLDEQKRLLEDHNKRIQRLELILGTHIAKKVHD